MASKRSALSCLNFRPCSFYLLFKFGGDCNITVIDRCQHVRAFAPASDNNLFALVCDVKQRGLFVPKFSRERNRNNPLDAPDSGKADFSTVFAFLWGNNLSESKHNGVVIYTAKRRNYSFSCFSKHLSHNV